MTKKEKPTNLEIVEKELLADFGDEVLKRGSEIEMPSIIPTGILSVDTALGGGIPKGHITEIYGPPSSSKTLLLYQLIGECQKQGGSAVLIDAERSFEAPWAEKNGVNVEELRVVRPRYGEEAYEILMRYIEVGMDIVGLDSIANTVPKAELDGDLIDANIGLAARMNAKAMRKISTINRDTAIVLINQTRQNVSTFSFAGNPETTAGGKAIPFYASLRLNMRRIGMVSKGDEKTGGRFRVKVEKAKTGKAKMFSLAEFEVDLEHGTDIAKDLLQRGIAKGWAKKSGSWFEIGEKRCQGESAIKAYMKEAGLLEEWRERILNEGQEDE